MPVDALSEAHDPRDIRIPTYRLHRASGQAVVTLAGRDVYLGPHGTPASRREYRRRIAEWLSQQGCQQSTLAARLTRGVNAKAVDRELDAAGL